MISPKTVLVYIPCHDGRFHAGCGGGLAAACSAGLLAQYSFLNDCSDIHLARDLMVNSFLMSPYEWLVFIDSDIEFSPRDFRLLMDYPVIPDSGPGGPIIIEHPNPIMASAATKTPDGDDEIVCAEYSKKNDSGDVVRFGLGFTRIHRSVFSKLDEVKDSESGAPLLDYFLFKGKMVTDYFLSGVMAHQYFTEDMGFFQVVRMAGITPRIEQRTHLLHTGKKQYPYSVKVEATE